ncbi:MAG: hypothetical protein KDE22_15580 [Rhodobacterales bacterium]|nr:hypothetical protein [Rhodobacterales bacterium]
MSISRPDWAMVDDITKEPELTGETPVTTRIPVQEPDGTKKWISVGNLPNTAGGGETNRLRNDGTGEGAIAKTHDGATLPVKTLKAGANITITDGADEITIAAAGAGAHTHTLADITDAGDAAGKNVGTAAGTVAAGDHDHAGVYSPVAHDHDADYADIAHGHGGVYAPVGHDHDADYADIAHDHAGVYSAVGHTHDDRYYTETEVDAALAGKADSGHNHDTVYAKKAAAQTWSGTQSAFEMAGERRAIVTNATVTGDMSGSPVNLANGTAAKLTLTGNTTGLTFTGWPAGKYMQAVVRIAQGGSGGYSLAWAGVTTWFTDSGSAPDLSAQAAGDVTYVVLASFDGGTTIEAWTIGQE